MVKLRAPQLGRQSTSGAPPEPSADAPRAARGITPRALLLSVALLVLTTLWVRQAELIASVNNISETVPSMPAIGALLLLALAQALGRRIPWFCNFSPAEKVVVYAFVSVGVMPLAQTWIRWLLPYQIIPFYFATSANRIAVWQRYLPAWLAPHDTERIRQYYEGSPDGHAPWGAWLLPMAAWFVLLMLLWVTLLCLMTLVRRQWTEHERLAFPLLHLPLSIVGGGDAETGTRGFFRNPLMWTGFSLACIHNLLNALAAFYPNIPALGLQLDLKQFFPDPPWNQITTLNITHRLELVGLGYLMPSQILFTAGFTYLAGQFLRVLLYTRGYEIRQFPYAWEQAAGAYAAFVLFALWIGRRHLGRVLSQALGVGQRRKAEGGGWNPAGPPLSDSALRLPPSAPSARLAACPTDADEPLSYRAALLGLIAGSAGILGWAHLMGMRLAPAAAFFGLVFLFALGTARIRAESGAPILRMFPPYQAMLLPVGLVGSETLRIWAGLPTLAVWSSLFGIAAHTVIPGAAYHLELFKLGDHAGVRRRHMAAVSVAALAVGIVLAYWMLLATAYRYGANSLEFSATGPPSTGTRYALTQYTRVAGWLETPEAADGARRIAVAAGFAIAAGLALARLQWLWMPLHPTGYAIGLIMGHHAWAPLLFVWMLKLLIVRLGGPGLYRRLIPAFLGLALGEFFAAGLVWGLAGAFFPDAARAYRVWYL